MHGDGLGGDLEFDAGGGRAGGKEFQIAEMEEGASHGAFAGPEELRRVGVHFAESEDSGIGKSDFHMFRIAGAEGIDADERMVFSFGERNGLGGVGAVERFQVIEDFTGSVAAHTRVGKKTDAVRAVDFLRAGIRSEKRFYERKLSEKGGGEKRRVRTAGEKIFRHGAIAHVAGGTKRSFPVTEPPVPRGVRESGLRIADFLYAIEIEVGDGDEFADKFRRLRWEKFADGHGSSFGLG